MDEICISKIFFTFIICLLVSLGIFSSSLFPFKVGKPPL